MCKKPSVAMIQEQGTFFGNPNDLAALSPKNDRLMQFNSVIDIAPLVAIAGQIWNGNTVNTGQGRPRWSNEVMLRVLLLKRFYNLSDENTEYALRDRLSFMRFCGLGICDKVPDQKTIWLYNELLAKSDGARKLFDTFWETLAEKGLKIKEGMMIDATIVPVPVQRNTKEENKMIKEGQTPPEWLAEPSKLSQKDVDAQWVKKGNESFFGYKNHTKTGAISKLVRDYRETDASVHDSQPAPELIQTGDERLHADSAYVGPKIAGRLEECGVENQVHEKGTRRGKLTEEQKRSNREKSKIRARVEHPFAFMENSLGGIYNRCIGRNRNAHQTGMMNLCYNLWRAFFLLTKKPAWVRHAQMEMQPV